MDACCRFYSCLCEETHGLARSSRMVLLPVAFSPAPFNFWIDISGCCARECAHKMCTTFILLELQKTPNAPGKLWKCVKEGCTRLIFCRYLDYGSLFFFLYFSGGGGRRANHRIFVNLRRPELENNYFLLLNPLRAQFSSR